MTDLYDLEEVAPAAQPPRALIVTVFGLYVRELGGWTSVSVLIRLLETVGVDAQAVRSAVSRLKRRGILEAERRDGRAGYALSPVARDILAAGDRRIFALPADDDEEWVLVVFSVPESERQQRHVLRSRLTWLGFGTVTSGVWIAPAHLADDARDVLARDGLDRYADLFVARHVPFGDAVEQVERWWDLEVLGGLYDAFLEAHGPVLERWRTTTPTPGEAFADYVRALTAWRRLPFLDPGLPSRLLPADWSGAAAASTFFALRDLLEAPARRHVTAVLREA